MKDPLKEYRGNKLVNCLIDLVLDSDYAESFLKSVFPDAHLVMPEVSGRAFNRSVDSEEAKEELSKSGAGDGIERISVSESSNIINVSLALNYSSKIWSNLKSSVENIPVNLRYLCKIIVTILDTHCENKLSAQDKTDIIMDIVFSKLIFPTLSDPVRFSAVTEVSIGDYNFELMVYVGKILRGSLLNTPIKDMEEASSMLEDFARDVREGVEKFVSKLLDFALPDYECDAAAQSGEMISAQGICISMENISFMFGVFVHNYRYYCKKYRAMPSLLNSFMYYVEKEDIFAVNERLFGDLQPDRMTKAHKYFVFTSVEIAMPKIEEPEIFRELPEIVRAGILLGANH